MVAWYGTNEYNFEKMPDPPAFEPTTCQVCGGVIVLGDGGYAMSGGGYTCHECFAFPESEAVKKRGRPRGQG